MVGKATLAGIPREDVPLYWAAAAEHLQRVPEFSTVYHFRKCAEGHAQLYLMERGEECIAAALTCVSFEPEPLVLITHAAGRDVDDWAEMFAGEMKAMADSLNAKLRIIGRKGWARKLRGFRQVAVVLEAD